MTTSTKSTVQVYSVEEGRRYVALSGSQPGQAYEIICHSQQPGDLSCNCPGFTYRHYCKHVDAVMARLERAQAGAMQQLEMQIQDLYR